MNRRHAAAVLMLLVAQVSAAQRHPDFNAFDKYVEKAVRDWNAVGLGIAIVQDDSLVFAKGYGALELGKPARVNRSPMTSPIKVVEGAGLSTTVFPAIKAAAIPVMGIENG